MRPMLVGAFCFSLCFGTQEIQSNIDPQFKVLVKESLYLPDTLSGMCPAAWGDKRRREDSRELHIRCIHWKEKSYQTQAKSFWQRTREQVVTQAGDLSLAKMKTVAGNCGFHQRSVGIEICESWSCVFGWFTLRGAQFYSAAKVS